MNKEHLKHIQDHNTIQGIGVIELERLYDKCNKLTNDLLNEESEKHCYGLEKEVEKIELEIKTKLKELFNNK
ncbi:MAG: hypothetical protein GY828_03975 [Candidatus Gracilibacteria bacterium]|nr:hypothetical protein [Candidatus Gracilibacteria bacterium]